MYSNPAEKLERVPMRAKQLTLPSRDQFLRLVDAVEHAGAWCSQDCADFLSGLAFTGCAKGKQHRSNGATWTSKQTKSLCAAILKPERRTGQFAECR